MQHMQTRTVATGQIHRQAGHLVLAQLAAPGDLHMALVRAFADGGQRFIRVQVPPGAAGP